MRELILPLRFIAHVYDVLYEFWENPVVAKRITFALTAAFVGAGVCIVANRAGLLPAPLDAWVPTNPFAAIRLAFSLILAMEVMELIFAISESLSQAVAKQMEIMALILLRESFTDISLISAHPDFSNDWPILAQVACTATAAVVLFVIRGLFSKWYKGLTFNDNLLNYVSVKKSVSVFLLCVFICAGVYDGHGILFLGNKPIFFEIFYTSLIFTDILMVLVSQYFMPCFHATFRNSGYAVGTLLMRIALGAPHALSAGICVFAGLYLLALTWSTARFMPPGKRTARSEDESARAGYSSGQGDTT